VIDLNPTPAELPPPVHAVEGDVGLGKTRAWRESVAANMVRMGMPLVLAVPRHRLGEEVVGDLAKGMGSRRASTGVAMQTIPVRPATRCVGSQSASH